MNLVRQNVMAKHTGVGEYAAENYPARAKYFGASGTRGVIDDQASCGYDSVRAVVEN
ncbi:MAG: hypothetical protein WAL52_22810 [Candidatus Sulfotelmatobacter sp.]